MAEIKSQCNLHRNLLTGVFFKFYFIWKSQCIFHLFFLLLSTYSQGFCNNFFSALISLPLLAHTSLSSSSMPPIFLEISVHKNSSSLCLLPARHFYKLTHAFVIFHGCIGVSFFLMYLYPFIH